MSALRPSQIEALRYVKKHSTASGMPCQIAFYEDGARVYATESVKAPSPFRLNVLIRRGLLEADRTGISNYSGAVKLTAAGKAALAAKERP